MVRIDAAASCVANGKSTLFLVRSGSLDLMGGLHVDSFAEGVEGADPEVRMVNHGGVSHAAIPGVLKFKPDAEGLVCKDDDLDVENAAHARVPGHEGVDALRNVGDGEMALGIGDGVIGIRHGDAPRLHEFVESAFQVQDASSLCEGKGIDEWVAREVMVGFGAASGVMGIHAKRAMKHDGRFKGSDFVHQDVVDNGVHVHDAEALMVPHGHDRRSERTVPGFYGRGGVGKCFAPVNAFQHDDDVLKSSVRSNAKLINEPPSGAGGNPSAKDGFRVGNEIKGFRRRRGAFHHDRAGNVSAVGDRMFGIGPDWSSRQESQDDDQGTSHTMALTTQRSCSPYQRDMEF